MKKDREELLKLCKELMLNINTDKYKVISTRKKAGRESFSPLIGSNNFEIKEVNDAEEYFVFTVGSIPSTVGYTKSGKDLIIKQGAPGDWKDKTKSLGPHDENLSDVMGGAKK